MSDTVKKYRIEKILDKYNVVIVGDGPIDLRPNEEVIVFAAGSKLNEKVPLLLPKATLRIQINGGIYATAKSDDYHQEERSVGLPTFMMFNPGRPTIEKVSVLSPLKVDEKDVSGNPGNAPIKVGDLVLKEGDLQKYILELNPPNPEPAK